MTKRISLRILESVQEIAPVENIQRQIWPGSEADIVPSHLLLTAVHNGGLLIAAFDPEPPEDAQGAQWLDPQAGAMVGFVFGFPGLYYTPDGPRLKHCSHMLGVLPGFRDQGVGFRLKRAQWQMVRHQGLDRITWTYDPLLSRNAFLNIARLGGVCNTYLREVYGEMRDGLNFGLPSDRFQVDWWVNTQRVFRRLSKHPRRPLDLAHFLSAGVSIINPTSMRSNGLPVPAEEIQTAIFQNDAHQRAERSLLLVEIPADIQAIKNADHSLALAWRLHTRFLFEELFQRGYIITDFVHLSGPYPRSFYVLSYGESTL